MKRSLLPRLGIMIPALLGLWAVSCVLIHGPALLGYIALQGMTSGIFALAFYLAEKKALTPRRDSLVARSETPQRTGRQVTTSHVLAE